MNIKSILAVTDLSARESMVIERARQLARAHRATVKLMHLPARAHAASAAAPRLADAVRQLEESLELRVRAAPLVARRLEDVVAQARSMDLVILPQRQERSVAAFFRGQPVLQLLRRCDVPVLVTRGTAGAHYRRILVAVDFSAASKALVKLAAGLEARAHVEIFHAISTLNEARLRSAEATEDAVRAYRARCLQDAQNRMAAFIGSLGAPANGSRTMISRGDPGRQAVIHQELTSADLVVVGKRRSRAWEDFVYDSVAHRILGLGTSDVLVVPHARESAAVPGGARRPETGHARA